MSHSKTIPIWIEDFGGPRMIGALPKPELNVIVGKVVDVALDRVQEGITDLVKSVSKLASEIPVDDAGLNVAEVSFSIRLDASGKVSLFSAASGSIGASACIEFHLRRRPS